MAIDFSALFHRASNAVSTAVQTVMNQEQVKKVTDSTRKFFQDTAQGCLELYIPSDEEKQQPPPVVGEVDNPREDKGEETPTGIGETWAELPVDSAIPPPQQDDLFGPNVRPRGNIDPVTATEMWEQIRQHTSLAKSRVVFDKPQGGK